MKWFKHFSDASHDEFISDIEDEFGLAGYARWWKLIESIASQMDGENDKCSAIYSEKKWCRLLQCKPKVLYRFLECTDNAGKTKTKQTDNVIEIECRKLLNLRDNHTRNLQAPAKPIESDLALEVEVEVEVEKPKRVNNKTPSILLPEYIDPVTWAGYVDMRKHIKSPMTERAMQLAINKLIAMYDLGQVPNDILDQSTINSWKGLFEVKNDGKKKVINIDSVEAETNRRNQAAAEQQKREWGIA